MDKSGFSYIIMLVVVCGMFVTATSLPDWIDSYNQKTDQNTVILYPGESCDNFTFNGVVSNYLAPDQVAITINGNTNFYQVGDRINGSYEVDFIPLRQNWVKLSIDYTGERTQ